MCGGTVLNLQLVEGSFLLVPKLTYTEQVTTASSKVPFFAKYNNVVFWEC